MWTKRMLALAGVGFVATCVALIVSRSTPEPEPPTVGGVETAHAPKKKKKKAKPRKYKAREVQLSASDELACPACNVILISIDTLRADHLGSYGYARPTSPNIDAFAADALLFENALSQSTWTTPAHASMFTGLLPRDHGVVLYQQPGRVSEETPTLASRLRAQSYRTAAFHGSAFVRERYGLAQGFDVFESRSRRFKKNMTAAQDWIEKNGHKPFFLFLHGFDVQRPYRHDELNTFHQPAQEYDVANFCRKDKRVVEGDELATVIATYDGGVVYTDELIGRFIRFLDDHKLLDNSIVIVTSDHGEEFFEHGHCDHGQALYDEQLRVPLIIHLPTKAKARVKPQVAASLGIVPTVMGMLGLEDGVDMSFDLRKVIKGEAAHENVISETGRGRKSMDGDKRPKLSMYKASLTTPKLKLIYSREGDEERYELYARDTDPAEKKDLARSRARSVKELKKLLFPPNGEPILPKLDEVPAAPAAAAEVPAQAAEPSAPKAAAQPL